MSSNARFSYENIFSSLISDIKSYNGMDPLLPWLRGIRKLKETLPPQLLNEKLPRFLQKCAETFISDRRYSNDLRYLRVWLQLMDFVDEPKAVLKTMEMNRIGTKKSLFYQAYALYYEKMKKFDAAEKIYHLGVQNLAEPVDELQKAYEQFLHRWERHKNKIVQLHGGKTNKGRLNCGAGGICKDHLPETEAKFADDRDKTVSLQCSQNEMHKKESNHKPMAAKSSNIGVLEGQLTRKVVVNHSGDEARAEQDENKQLCSDDTVVVRFVDTAIVGKSNAEDARHHGLVEPTINTKEAMNAINSMFREPLEPSIPGRTSRKKSSTVSSTQNGFRIFSDEGLESQQTTSEFPSLPQLKKSDNSQSQEESFEIYVDDDEAVDVKEEVNGKGIPTQGSNNVTVSSNRAPVSARPNNIPSECFKDLNSRRPIQDGLREDTVVRRFVGSTISEEPEVENVWHHGLVEPTINFKEAMKDINSMFGKPIEFTRKSRIRKHNKASNVKDRTEGFLILPDDDSDDTKDDAVIGKIQEPLNMDLKGSPENRNKVADVITKHTGFLILPDDELDTQQSSRSSTSTRNGNELFEQTVCTKEALDEINKLFSMPMDF